jgi:hypothetical protein
VQVKWLTRGTLLRIVTVTVTVAATAAGTASADTPTTVCLSAVVEGQKLQRDGKLLYARDKYAACAVRTCPPEVVDDCVGWLHEVDQALPSVVLAARDEKGVDLKDVEVSVDGSRAVPTGTRAVPLDPGSHTFVFHHEGAERKQQLVLREGEKNREILVVFERLEPPRATSRPVPPSAWAAGGVGIAAMGAFGVFGALGVSERGSNHCDTGCTGGQKNSVDTKFLVADIALGVGLVALAAATWLYLTRPTVEKHTPEVTLDAGGALRFRF